jgi:hypothetical protein
MKHTFRLVCMALLLFTTGAEAASWHAVATNEKMKIEMDTASIVKTGKVVAAWDKEVYFGPEQAQPGDFYFKSVKTLRRYGCGDHVVQPLMQVYYADDGSEIKTVILGEDGMPGYVVPDSMEELRFDYVCATAHAAAKKRGTKPKKMVRPKPEEKVVAKKEDIPVPKAAAPAKVQSPAAKQATAVGGVQAAPTVPAKPAQAPQAAPRQVSMPIRSPSEPVTALETLTKSPTPTKKP